MLRIARRIDDMGLYNLMWGTNPVAPTIMNAFEIPIPPRFRDACIYKKDDRYIVEILARQGGGNREYHKESNEELAAHPNFVSDRDFSDYDVSYNIITFDVTNHPITKEFIESQKKYPNDEIISSQTRFTMTLADVTKRAGELIEEKPEQIAALGRQMRKAIDKGGGIIVIDEDGPELVEERTT